MIWFLCLVNKLCLNIDVVNADKAYTLAINKVQFKPAPDKGNEITKMVCEKDVHIYLYVYLIATNPLSYTGKGKDQFVDF